MVADTNGWSQWPVPMRREGQTRTKYVPIGTEEVKRQGKELIKNHIKPWQKTNRFPVTGDP